MVPVVRDPRDVRLYAAHTSGREIQHNVPHHGQDHRGLGRGEQSDQMLNLKVAQTFPTVAQNVTTIVQYGKCRFSHWPKS